MDRLRIAVATIAALGLFACSDGDQGADSTTTRPPAPTTTDQTTTTAPLTDEQAVLAAVEGYWEALFLASNPADPNHPDLETYLTGEALRTSREVLEDRKLHQLAVRLPEDSIYDHSSEVLSLERDSAVVQDCGVDDGVLYEIATGAIVNDDVSTTLRELELVRTDGAWKVSVNRKIEQWEGVAGCAGG